MVDWILIVLAVTLLIFTVAYNALCKYYNYINNRDMLFKITIFMIILFLEVAFIPVTILLYDRISLGVIFGIITGLSVIILVIVSIFWFKETYTWIQWLGFSLIVVGVILVSINATSLKTENPEQIQN